MPKIWEKFFARPCRPDDLDRARARWLVLGAGTLLAKLDGKALPIEADQERLWTLLSVAYGHGVPLAVLGSLRRVAKHWQGGDKCLAAIYLAQMGLPGIGKDAAYRLALAAELIDAGVGPRELGFDLPAGLLKYDPNEPRVPAGSGRESGQWTSSADAASVDAAESPLTEGRSVSANAGDINREHERPKDAIVVTRPDDRKSMIRIQQPNGSWLRHGQIFRRSMQLANGLQIGR